MASTLKKNNIPSAVLVPILIPENSSENIVLKINGQFEIPENAELLFTIRTQNVEHHKGQISFPGGKFETSDSNLLQTALRETHEEIGIEPGKIQIIQELPAVPIQRSGFIVSPFVGLLDYSLSFTLSNFEIDKILRVPIHFFINPANSVLETIEHQGLKYKVRAYYFNENRIWGATASIVDHLIQRNKTL